MGELHERPGDVGDLSELAAALAQELVVLLQLPDGRARQAVVGLDVHTDQLAVAALRDAV
ncbi:MAG: hypothetical protein ACRDZ4_15255 [Egibacteraceae bacterium]